MNDNDNDDKQESRVWNFFFLSFYFDPSLSIYLSIVDIYFLMVELNNNNNENDSIKTSNQTCMQILDSFNSYRYRGRMVDWIVVVDDDH